MTTFLPFNTSRTALYLTLTLASRPACVGWMNVRPDVVIADERELERAARFVGVPERRRIGRIRHAEHQLRARRRALAREPPTERPPRRLDGPAEDDAVRPREIHVLEDAPVQCRRRGSGKRGPTSVVGSIGHDLAGLHLPLVPRAHDVQCAGLRRKHRRCHRACPAPAAASRADRARRAACRRSRPAGSTRLRRRGARRPACPPARSALDMASRWTSTSESIVELKMEPRSSSSMRSSVALVMLPLWASAMWPRETGREPAARSRSSSSPSCCIGCGRSPSRPGAPRTSSWSSPSETSPSARTAASLARVIHRRRCPADSCPRCCRE